MVRFQAKDVLYSIGQVMLIFVGITMATWYENRNESRKEEEFEEVLLQEMIVNLKSDRAWIRNEMEAIEAGIEGSRKILLGLDGQQAYFDSLRFYMVDIMVYSTSSYNTSAYETIKSKGLNLIRDNELRKKITEYYEVTIKDNLEQQKVSYNLTWSFLAPYASENFKDFSFTSTTPLDPDALRKDKKFRQLMNMSNAFKKLGRTQFAGMDKKAAVLIEELEKR